MVPEFSYGMYGKEKDAIFSKYTLDTPIEEILETEADPKGSTLGLIASMIEGKVFNYWAQKKKIE